MESRLAHDFSDVRVHAGGAAAESARAVDALAYTVGQHIVFASGRYAPATDSGKRTLAHELSHVIQQKIGTVEGTLRADGIKISSPSDPSEREADAAAARAITGLFPKGTGRFGEAKVNSAGTIGRGNQSSGDGLLLQRQGASGAAPAAPSVSPRRLSVDVLGSDMPADSSIVLAAAKALGVDIRVKSLEDMVNRVEALVDTGSCVGELQIWNHGAPGYQEVFGEGGKKLKAGTSSAGFSSAWLFDPSHLPVLGRLRRSFCCAANMVWRGCATAGVETSSGIRTEAETLSDRERYGRFGSRYQSETDVLAHGGSLFGATLGQVDIRLWADATCATIRAATDFTLIGPGLPGGSQVQHGGTYVVIPPEPGEACACDVATGRPAGGPPTFAHLYERETALRAATIGVEHEWDLHLRRVRDPGHFPDAGSPGEVLGNSMVRLVLIASRRLTLPTPLAPKADGEVWPRLAKSTGGDRAQAAVFPNLAFCEPDNYWRWMLVSPGIFVSTPEFTAGILLHELRHAADITVAAGRYRHDHPAPSGAPSGDQCKPAPKTDVAGWTDPWGTYIRDFIDAYQGGLSATRHMEIAVGEREVHFERWTSQEQLDWLRGILQVLPPRVPATTLLPGEDTVNTFFLNASPAMKQGIVDVFREPFEGLLMPVASPGHPGASAADRHATCDRVRTQFTHFRPVVTAVARYYAAAGGGVFIQDILTRECP